MLIPYNAPPDFDWVTRAADWQQQGNTLMVEVVTAYEQSAQVIFRAVSPDIWQIEFTAARRAAVQRRRRSWLANLIHLSLARESDAKAALRRRQADSRCGLILIPGICAS